MRFEAADLEPWFEFRADRAAGPGGQHVNKVSTRITLLFDFEHCPRFTPPQRDWIRTFCASRLSADGRVRVVAQRERSQSANREAATQRLLQIIAEALHRPMPRIATRPTAGARRRRLSEKRRNSQRKDERRFRDEE